MQRDVLLHRSCRIHGLNWRMADFTFVHAQGTSYFCRELPTACRQLSTECGT